jgi:serine/threonine protein kinase
MPDKIGRFSIVSQLAHSDHSAVYKASDPDSGSFVALKAVQLQTLGEQARMLIEEVVAEAEKAKVLNSHNVASLYGAGEMDGQLCALMEYVQGNSIATMLERKEGFSIWDLQDIARQTCQGLDHAHGHKVIHHSLEPAKIMVQWDGITRILGFGISKTGDFAAQCTGAAPQILHYMSPEQLRGDPLDARSNLFSLGAILYEMVTEQKAFPGEQSDEVRQGILEMMPAEPGKVNPRIHPGLSAVIMKALAKSPEERFQSGQELINDLEKCKDAPAKAGAVKKTGLTAPSALKPVAPKQEPKPAMAPKPAAAATTPQHFAAAAGQGIGNAPSTPSGENPSSDFISTCVKATIESVSRDKAQQSAATAEPETKPRFAVDPMMEENRQGGSKTRSFSEIEELPPLKEVYIAPTPPPEQVPEVVEAKPSIIQRSAEPPKPKTPPREIAKIAVTEIKKTPPKLFAYSISGAVALILIVISALAWHFRSESDDDNPVPAPAPAQTAQSQAPATPASPAPATAQQVAPSVPQESQPAVSVSPRSARGNARKKVKPAPAAPAIINGQLSVDSTPQGAQIQVDGQKIASLTPFNLSDLTPGQHTVTVSKDGFAPQTRTISVAAGANSVMSVQLAPLTASVSLTSDPSGSAIWMDGKDTGHVTPAQFAVDKPGSHTFVFKKPGYLDENASASLQVGQTSHLSASLKELGQTDDIKVGGKFKKIFGGSETAGMGMVSIKTQPKGAQIAVNSHIVDKMSPVQFYLNPGTYVIDITLSGFKDIHKVITVDKNGKVAIDENMDRE